ncbi:hypothetical protein ACFQPA_10130 [Halomarina halobia]|uniref:DUF8080 domain-containing protein n=1 Tax=Halomarina halobia TaxID=3033386 RepID=A0ABD6AAW5_9EURY|nr:hypothetical protein [Halomarina sp. PSR21]
MDIEWSQRRRSGVTFVSVVLRSARRRRVRLTSHLAPIWPPRRRGAPEPGWTDEGFEGSVEGTLALGFATPARPTDGEPVAVESLAADEGSPTFDRPDWAPAVEATPDGVVRALSDPRPPRAAVPVPERAAGGDRSAECGSESDDDEGAENGRAGGNEEATGEREGGTDREATDARGDGAAPLHAAAATLPTIEARIEAGEELAAVETLDDATAALERVGGLAGARALRSALEDDRETLARLEARVADLRRRASLDLPIETLERVA